MSNNHFARVQIYCTVRDTKEINGFQNILFSKKPIIVVNLNHIVSLGPVELYDGSSTMQHYPFRMVNLDNGESYYGIVESVDELEKIIFSDSD